MVVGCHNSDSQTQGESELNHEQKSEWREIVKQRELREAMMWSELKDNPPLPPWLAYPSYGRYSIGWRMGAGEEHIDKLYVYFKNVSKETYESYRLQYPEPEGWKGWYDE